MNRTPGEEATTAMKSDAESPTSIVPAGAGREIGFGLSLDAWGRLVLIDSEGRRFVGVEPVRAFPISHPDRWISICDAEGREVLAIESLGALAPATRQVLEAELALREFIPVLQRIVSVSVDSFPSEWAVQTDKGPTRFTLDHEEDIRLIGSTRVMITDARRLRYQVPDIKALDTRSRRLLERFL
jgi:hypothetical protein